MTENTLMSLCCICSGANTQSGLGGFLMKVLELISDASAKKEVPVFNIGDTVKVDVNIKEGNRERIQIFEGTVIAMKGSGISSTFTVRRSSYGVGVERVFPLHSPNVKDVKVIRKGKVRRSKLYYLRDRVGKAAKVKEKVN
jgi:large subunit ribosomal protein L19